MNYYDARQRSDNGRWDYTSANRRTGTHPVGYCASRIACPCWVAKMAADPDCEQCAGSGFVDNPDHCGGHDTAEEARECFARYLLDGAEERSYTSWHGCQHPIDGHLCDAPTKIALETRRPLGSPYFLCDEHRTIENLRALAPTDAGQICASW